VDLEAPSSFLVPAMRETDLATKFPAGTVIYVELRDLGSTLRAALEGLLEQVPADDREDLASLEQLLGTPLPSFLDPVQDAALGVSFADGQFQAGIAATLSDAEAAQRRVTALVALIRLAGGRDAPFEVSQGEIAGVPATTFTFRVDDTMAFSMPVPPSVSLAIADDRMYLGFGDFVEAALTQDAATSLAADPRYVNAATTAGVPNIGLGYLDIAALQAVFESTAGADDSYTTDVKPWLDALDYLVISETANGQTLSTKALLFVR
jgi:hypothetical protein